MVRVDNNAFALELRLDGAAALTTQCCSKSVSTKSLPKNRNNWEFGRRLSEILLSLCLLRIDTTWSESFLRLNRGDVTRSLDEEGFIRLFPSDLGKLFRRVAPT